MMKLLTTRLSTLICVVYVGMCVAQEIQTNEDRGTKPRMVTIDFIREGPTKRDYPFGKNYVLQSGEPVRLLVGELDGIPTPIWITYRDHWNDGWDFRKSRDGYTVQVADISGRTAEFYRTTQLKYLQYDVTGKSMDVMFSSELTEGCMWEIDEAVRVNYYSGFDTPLKAKSGKAKGWFLAVDIPNIASTLKPDKREYYTFRLKLSKERQGHLLVSRRDN